MLLYFAAFATEIDSFATLADSIEPHIIKWKPEMRLRHISAEQKQTEDFY